MKGDARFADCYIPGKDSRETKAGGHAQAMAKNARTQLRANYIASITTKRVSLEKATNDIVLKFDPRAASDGALPIRYLLHMALVRRFMLDNADCCKIEVNEANEDEDDTHATSLGTDDDDDDARPPPAKKRKTTHEGRVPKSRDFFAVLEQWLGEKIKEFGSDNLAGPEWREYMKDVIRRDHSAFGVSSLPSIAQLPAEYVVQRRSPTPAPFATDPSLGQYNATYGAPAGQQAPHFQPAPAAGPSNGAGASLAGAGGADFFGSFGSFVL